LGKDAGKIISNFDGVLPEWTEDSFPGILMNVTAGRIANRLDLGGTNYTVDAACASSLAAVHLGVRELESGASDIVIAGGADTMQNPFTFLCFSKTQALSPSGNSRPLDQSADGIVIGEGIAAVVLKRLADAKRDGDRVYAIIKGSGASSDGRGKSLTAPHPDGQIRALERAYIKANVSPGTLSLVEAHATGTTVGDKAEIEALHTFLIRHQTPAKACAVGSVKSMIGHTKSTAGIASIIKVALSLYYKTLPPSLNVKKPIAPLDSMESPLYVNTCRRPWLNAVNGQSRRAGVSAFGFGGTNFHVAMEENSDYFGSLPSKATFCKWPSEVFIWRQKDLNKLIAEIRKISEVIRYNPQVPLSDLAFTVNRPFVNSSNAWNEQSSSAFNLAIVATSQVDLKQKIETIQIELNDSGADSIDKKGIFFCRSIAGQRKKIAFLFPGQGSQYVDMMADLPIQFPRVRKTFENSDVILRNQLPKPLSAYIYPPPSSDKAVQNQYDADLRQTNIAQSAMGTVDLAVFRLLKEFGVAPDIVAGHSYGEYVALCAAGVISTEDLILLSEARGRFIMQAMEQTPGTMAAVNADGDVVARHIRHISNIAVANVNAPEQTVVSGAEEAVAEAVEHFNGIGYRVYPIPVSGAFHSPLITAAAEQLSDYMKKVNFCDPCMDVYSNVNAAPYPGDPKEIPKQLVRHMVKGVQFVDQIEAMYENGASIFVECGPKNVLGGLVNRILGERSHCMIGSDSKEQSALTQICHILGNLAAHGVKINLGKLYHGRTLKQLDLEKLAKGLDKPEYSSSMLLVSGANAMPVNGGHDSEPDAFNRVIEPMMLPVSTVVTNPASDAVSNKDSSSRGGHFPTGQQRPVVVEQTVGKDQRDVSGKAPPATGHGAGAMTHFQQIMSKFLETQNRVMNAYFSNSGRTAESVIKAPAANNERLAGNNKPNDPCLDSQSEPVAAPLKDRNAHPARETSAPGQLGAASPVQRSIMVTEPLPGLIGNAPKASNDAFIITEDEYGIAKIVADKLNARKITVVVVAIGEATKSLVNGRCQVRLDSSEDAARLLKTIRSEVGPIGGFIHLSPLNERRTNLRMDTDNWRMLLEKQAKHLFFLAKEFVRGLDDAVEQDTACFIAATATGDIPGDRRETANFRFYPGQAGIAGLLKCMAIEWPLLNIKAIDFPLDASPEEIIDPLLAEIATDDKVVEIKYRNGQRLCLKPQVKPLSIETTPCLSLNDEWIILVTGGARGITFEVTLELARQYQPTLLIVGRSPLPSLEEASDTSGLTDAKSIKAALMARVQTPENNFSIAQVEKAYHRLIKEREIRRNLKAIKNAGSQFEYFDVDAADPRAFGELVDQIYRTYNRLDGVIHGAGIIEDKLIRDKTPESFERVFGTKVASGFTLGRKLHFESLRFIVFFTSVAGLFGNRGQSDYAAANEVLNKLALFLDARWPARVVAINWGPWAKKGMVSDALEKQFAQRGITMVPPCVGVRKMIEELCYGRKGDTELIIGGMNWSAGPAYETEQPIQSFPLLTSGTGARHTLAGRDEATKQLNLHHDLYLRDHVLDGKPVLPAAMAMELLTEFAKLQVPNLSLIEIADFRVLKGIVIDSSHRDIRLKADVIADAPDAKHFAVRIMGTRNSRQVYYSVEVLLGRHLQKIERWPFHHSTPMQPFDFTIRETYKKWLFHGPTFKGINEIQGSNDEGIRAWLIPSSPDSCLSDVKGGAWLIDPVVVDCIFQLHIIWARKYRGMTSLPTYIKSYKQLRPLSGDKIDCQIMITNASTGSSIIQSEIGLFNQGGVLLGIMNGCESTCSKSLNRLSENNCKMFQGIRNVCR
jgi:acyl transferase domain-containing protein/NAD(P)-dependent dehydrogenase (short-subunit alcohol dehydrogenase family)